MSHSFSLILTHSLILSHSRSSFPILSFSTSLSATRFVLLFVSRPARRVTASLPTAASLIASLCSISQYSYIHSCHKFLKVFARRRCTSACSLRINKLPCSYWDNFDGRTHGDRAINDDFCFILICLSCIAGSASAIASAELRFKQRNKFSVLPNEEHTRTTSLHAGQ